MPHRHFSHKNEPNNPLKEYVTAVHDLHRKLARINANQQDVSASLGRAAAALRSMGTPRIPRNALESGK